MSECIRAKQDNQNNPSDWYVCVFWTCCEEEVMGELGTQVSFLSPTYAFEMAGGELKLSSFSCSWVVNRVLVLPCIFVKFFVYSFTSSGSTK